MAISNDELLEILSWLPAKAIHKLKCSSKIFSELSHNPCFAAKQAENALTKDSPSCFFIQRVNSNYFPEFHPLPGNKLSSGIPRGMIRFLSASDIKILSSSNGLILCRNNQTELFIINPSINSFFHVPLPDHMQTFRQEWRIIPDFDMTMECDSDDCKVFFFSSEFWGSKFDCHVYSQKEGSWSKKEKCFSAGSRNLKFDNPVICNGAIHFVSDCFRYIAKGSTYFRPYIVSYDMANGDKNTLIRIPKEARRGSHDDSCDMSIFKWSQSQSMCLVRLRKRVFTVWILTNYESCGWRRILKVRVRGMGLMEQNPVIIGFVVLNGDLVFATKKKVYSYGLTGEKYMVLSEICEHGCDSRFARFVSYSDTLRPCGISVKSLRFYLSGDSSEYALPNKVISIASNKVAKSTGKVVCVTGASGYIASWIVKFLLKCGYTLRATVRDTSQVTYTVNDPQVQFGAQTFLNVTFGWINVKDVATANDQREYLDRILDN
ncbi:hypothetical protein PIB30_088141 [Stylosanthes scabra]|uniref:F-box associated beta-propeller type 3 domain-containing protein n=1 Tax=Stylosanthes scabra TaxID=79078 RepID=A0ABU6UUG7_9FABA|nr:hypothetical protein [Stylosanthes scabra]